MKKLRMLKKIISSILVAIIVLGQFSSYSFVSRAETITTEEGDTLSLTLSETSESGFAYKSEGKEIWSFVSEDDNGNKKYASNLYCIKAEYGYSWETADNASSANRATYDKSYAIPLQQETTISTTADNILLGQYKNQLLWLIDNLYVEDESNLDEYLIQAGIEYNSYDGYIYNPTLNTDYNYEYIANATEPFGKETVLPEDIIAIQQMAIWYFTNGLDTTQKNPYSQLKQQPWLQVGTTELLTLSEARAAHATIIYNYLIDKAQDVAEELGDKEYQLKNSTAKLWISSSKDEQPVIEVHRLPKVEEEETIFDLSLRKAIVEVKDSTGNIKEILNTKGESAERALNENGSIKNVDTTSLTEPGTTATYNHRKDPVVVEKGDKITYSITIYNESEQAGYANKIIDQLPGTWGTGLRLSTTEGTVTSSIGNKYKIEYSAIPNTITLTMTEDSPKKSIAPYNEETKTLESETILLECVVMGKPDTKYSKVLTNVAYIEQEYNAYNGVIVTEDTVQDRDSQTWEKPQETGNNLITTEIGYTGNSSNAEDLSSNETYYAGEQDDDDFEKLVILPEAFDLSLRKNITKVLNANGNEKTINDRTPQEVETNLNNGTSTTADYNHRKDAIAVENGNIVEYNITTYNEGNINGVATIVKDQLPTGLKLNKNFFTKEGEEYYVTSLKGNVYKVSYDETNNIITFELDKTKTENVVLLSAHESGQNLDKDVIALQCIVDCKPDDDQNIFLTNIAYIHQAEQEDGTIVTNQKVGTENESEADRDSEPHTQKADDTIFPTATELQSMGNVGYIGNASNPTNLAQEDVYFKGQQDDDDFEKLVILPEAFDLSLRKHITEVDGVEVDREPEIETIDLDNGASSTAEYKHRKDPVTVEDGSVIIYDISIYNEGNINGVATIVKDQLPTGIKLDLDYFDKEGEKYFVTSSKGNIYEVIYNEQTNLVEFKLDKNKNTTLKYLQAHQSGVELDEETITLKCEVNCVANENKNTYFTNIAYIYEAKQEDGTVVTNQTSGADSDRDSEPYTEKTDSTKFPSADELKTNNIGYIGHKDNTTNLEEDIYFKGQQDDDDFEKLVMLPKTFDLKLIKFITAVNEEATGNRVIKVDTSKLNNGETTADYILEKNPVSVKAGDFITYTIRVYNEGNYDGYATEISEDIPEGLEYLAVEDGGKISSWDGTNLKDVTDEIQESGMYDKIVEVNTWTRDNDSSIIKTQILKDELIKGFGQSNVEYADSQNKIDYKEIKVIFRVKTDVDANLIIRNEASISEDKAVDQEGEEINIADRDSSTELWEKKDSDKTYDEGGKWPIYEEDDEDYDNIITKAFDLSLRKQIIQINNALYTDRYSKLLDNVKDTNTLYDYYDVNNNKPKVKAGDKIVYSIRVYNEGDIDGYASLVVDKLPSGLEFVKESNINEKYGWTLVEGTEDLYQTDYLSYEKDVNKGTENSNLIKAYDGQGEADYKELKIECKVKADITKEDSLLNVAQIAQDSDEKGKDINDQDSIPGTIDNESKWKNEDDLDIENLQLQEFDLALRKFITEIANGEKTEKVTTRIPQVSYNEETKQLEYTHPKDAVVVHVGDTVIYTIRVYNEGDIDGYASEIKDDIPQYLEYLPEHETNKENEWVMYDKDGKGTENVEEAVFIKTERLAKGKGVEADEESNETNLIKAFDAESEISDKNPDYKEVKVAFKVKDPNSTEYEIVNFAQISDDSDSEGNPIKDKDSEPDNGDKDPKEDDEDIEKVKVEYFDLSLLKYVTKVLVNENGQEKVIETGNVGDENDIIPHVQINKKNIDKTVVKFVYTIQITNEGQIAGEATEITDYVPEGLIFMEEDNELWTDEGNNIISTMQLKGTTLQPGETAQVEVVLRWINGSDNLGPKTNVAEISEDYNEENIPDKDSTPDNKKEGEDDIDDATVLLSVNQGGGIQSIYINLSLTFLAIILVGGVLIKKFVL